MMPKKTKSIIISLIAILSAISFVIIVITYITIEASKKEKGGLLKSMGSGQKFTGFNKMLEKKKKIEERKKNLRQ